LSDTATPCARSSACPLAGSNRRQGLKSVIKTRKTNSPDPWLRQNVHAAARPGALSYRKTSHCDSSTGAITRGAPRCASTANSPSDRPTRRL
jgi:hypothetical protein